MNSIIEERIRGKEVKFIRIRRITGYLSVLEQFNTGKIAEEHDRIKHNTSTKYKNKIYNQTSY